MGVSSGKLQQLITVARSGSFSKAAAELNISQPALSRSIAAIEAHYGFQIFNRMGHGVHPTAAGAQVIAQAEPLLQSMRLFDNNLRLFASGKVGNVAIGFSALLASQVLGQFASEFFARGRRAQLRVLIRPGNILLDALKNDEIEIFFFPESQIEPTPEIEMEPVGSIIPACVVSSRHPLAARPGLKLKDLAGFPWASSVDPPALRGIDIPGRFICDNYHILRDAVLRSDLVCICSSSFVAQQLRDGTLREIKIKGLVLPETTIYMAKLRGRVLSPLAEEAVQRVRAHLKSN
jgi:DNA-binding transcriptional LysR family regulator